MESQAILEQVHQQNGAVILDFWATWCAPCRAMEPAMKQVSEQYAGQVQVIKVNADQHQELLRSLRVMSIPTLVAFYNGSETSRQVGSQPFSALEQFFAAAARGEVVEIKVTSMERLVRAGSGLGLMAIGGLRADPSILLLIIGAALAFSAVYDRCPIYKAVSGKISQWLNRGGAKEGEADRPA